MWSLIVHKYVLSFRSYVFKIEPIQKKSRKSNQFKLKSQKLYLVRMYSDHFFTQSHGLVRFAVLILSKG